MINLESSQLPEGYKQTDIGVIPEDWKFPLIDKVAKRGSGHTPSKKKITYYDGGIKWISLADTFRLDSGLISETEVEISSDGLDNSSAVLHSADTVLISRDAGVGKSAIMSESMAVSQHFITWLCSKSLHNWYLYYWLFSQKSLFETQAVGSTIKTLGLPFFKTLRIPLPKIEEQEAIAEVLIDVDALITSLDQLINKKRNIKQGAMQLLLTGKKRLPGFSDDWETKTLGETFEISAGGDFKPQFSTEVKDEKHPYPIYSNSISKNGLYGFSSYYVYIRNAITVTARGTLGFANYRSHNFTAIGRVLVLYPKGETDCFYVSEFINNRIEFVIESTGVPQLTAPQISPYEILIPSTMEEQKAIAQILSDMDAEIEALETKWDKYKAIKQGMMQELLTGKTRLIRH